MITTEQEQIAKIAKAMGHPTRVFILEYLGNQNCCYSGDLSEILPLAKSTLSQHLSELKKAGLIQGEIEAPKIKYCLKKKNYIPLNIRIQYLITNGLWHSSSVKRKKKHPS